AETTEEAAEVVEVATEEAAETATTTTEVAADAVEVVTEETIEFEVPSIIERGTFSLGGISRKLGGVFGLSTSALSSVNDEASAKSALPQLEKVVASLSEVSEQFKSVPASAKAPLIRVVKNGLARLQPLVDTKLNKEGVGSVLTPVMSSLMETLKGMSQ
ncbi:MAG: hypothetical protein ACI82O_000691, partial [Patiriisocius sp.]